MKTLCAKYKGNRVVVLQQEVELPQDLDVFVLVPGQDDEETLQSELQRGAEAAFARLWDNKEDDVWNEYV